MNTYSEVELPTETSLAPHATAYDKDGEAGKGDIDSSDYDAANFHDYDYEVGDDDDVWSHAHTDFDASWNEDVHDTTGMQVDASADAGSDSISCQDADVDANVYVDDHRRSHERNDDNEEQEQGMFDTHDREHCSDEADDDGGGGAGGSGGDADADADADADEEDGASTKSNCEDIRGQQLRESRKGRVFIIGEDHERMQPLLEELNRRRVPTTVWNTSGGILVPTAAPPPQSLFFCRQSPSAGCREHFSSIAYARTLLQWIEAHGGVVINGSRALEVEVNKALQLSILRQAGLATPASIVCHGVEHLWAACREITDGQHADVLPRTSPIIIKPNTGGSGTGIHSFASSVDACSAIEMTLAAIVRDGWNDSMVEPYHYRLTGGGGGGGGAGGSVGGGNTDADGGAKGVGSFYVSRSASARGGSVRGSSGNSSSNGSGAGGGGRAASSSLTQPSFFSTGFYIPSTLVEYIQAQLLAAPHVYDCVRGSTWDTELAQSAWRVGLFEDGFDYDTSSGSGSGGGAGGSAKASSSSSGGGGGSSNGFGFMAGKPSSIHEHLKKDLLTSARENMWVIQEHLGQYSENTATMRSVIRIEVIGGVVQRDYIVKITAPTKEFGLCPCDPKSAEMLARTNFMLVDDPLTIPGFRPEDFTAELSTDTSSTTATVAAHEAFEAFCRKIEAAFAKAGSLVGSVEGMPLWGCNVVHADGSCNAFASRWATCHEPVLFDFNTCNSNYNAGAEAAGGILPGVARVANLLSEALAACES
jgi:hypothetical protein